MNIGRMDKGGLNVASSLSLKFCRKNLEKYSQRVYDVLTQKYPDVKIEVEDCVDICGLCTDVPFALRNGAIVGGRNERDLYLKLERGMEFLQKPPLVTMAKAVQSKKIGDE